MENTEKTMPASFGIVLKEKEGTSGLTRSDTIDLVDMLDDDEWFPIEVMANVQECSAMGFISARAAEKLQYDYQGSGLNAYIANILDDMELENDSCTYDYAGISIWMSY